MVNKDEYFVTYQCPKDCPFRDKLERSYKFCSFSIYADAIEPGRRTRTEIHDDGSIDYHEPPDCDIYEKYKGKEDEIKKVKKKYDQYGTRRVKDRDSRLWVTGRKHSTLTKLWKSSTD